MTEGYHYTGCGLDYVYLANGFEIHETEYGRGMSIDDVEGLHDVIARNLITGRQRLRGQEVRFLRSLLDVSQGSLARVLGTTRSAVARWELKRDTPIPPTADRMLRTFYAGRREGNKAVNRILDLLEEIDELEYRIACFKESKQGWRRLEGSRAA